MINILRFSEAQLAVIVDTMTNADLLNSLVRWEIQKKEDYRNDGAYANKIEIIRNKILERMEREG